MKREIDDPQKGSFEVKVATMVLWIHVKANYVEQHKNKPELEYSKQGDYIILCNIFVCNI